MSVLSHYRDRLRGWGTPDLAFSTPPALTYSPKGHWGGLHHYMAHASAVEPNPEIYEMAMERAESSLGVGMHEARHWHRHAYGGLMELPRLSPAELGHAAAYEAFRYLLHHETLYEPLADEAEREREVLLSLAIAEATRLTRESPRFGDEFGLQAACSAAAATASLLYSQQLDIAELGPGHLSQRRAGRPYGSAYAEDDAALYRRAGIEESERGRLDDRSMYGGSAYGGRSGRTLSEEPPYSRSYMGGGGMNRMGMGGSRDPRTLANSPVMGGIDSPPYPAGPGGTSAGMAGSRMPVGGGASPYAAGMGGPPYGAGEAGPPSPLGTSDPRVTTGVGSSPYPGSPVNPAYTGGVGGFAPSAGVPDIQRAGSPTMQPGRAMPDSALPMPGDPLTAGRNQQAFMPSQPGVQSGYPGLNASTQAPYGGMPQSAYGGAPGAMPQTAYGGAVGGMPQAGYGGGPQTIPIGMPGAMPQGMYGGAAGGMPQAGYGGVPQPISSGLPGAMPQAPYAVAPAPGVGQPAYPGAQVYPPGSTIVLPSRKRRHRRRARSRDLDERDRYYRERRARDGYDSY